MAKLWPDSSSSVMYIYTLKLLKYWGYGFKSWQGHGCLHFMFCSIVMGWPPIHGYLLYVVLTK
jgi:hypothetical protein